MNIFNFIFSFDVSKLGIMGFFFLNIKDITHYLKMSNILFGHSVFFLNFIIFFKNKDIY